MSGRIKVIALFELLMTLAVSGAAQAETIYLTCVGDNAGAYTVDLAANTVNNLPATINATTINWQRNLDFGGGNTRVEYWKIDRVAGTLNLSFQSHFANGFIPPVVNQTSNCTLGSAPATKF